MNLISVLIFHGIFLLTTGHRCSPDGTVSRRAAIASESGQLKNTGSTPNDDENFEPNKHPNWNLLDNMLCGSSLADRIIGGINATLGQYPWIARIGYISINDPKNKPDFRCGGTLINSNSIITAAHCVINLPTHFKVGIIRLGEHDSTKEIDCEHEECADVPQDIEPAQILVHQQYSTPPFRHDLALIRLLKPAKYTKWVLPICLPWGQLMKKNFSFGYADVAGWGHYDMTRPVGSAILQTVKLPITNSSRCKRAFRRIELSEKSQMCVGGEKGRDSCNGDSGGPMMKVEVVNGPPRYYLIGVVSFGVRNCGFTPTPGVYSRITYYMSWILNNIQK